MPVAIVAIVMALLVGAAVWPEDPQHEPMKVPKMSPKAFGQDGLTLKGSGYAGSSLVIFTHNESIKSVKLEALIQSPEFQRKNAAWRSRDVLRVGRVQCNKYAALCERFSSAVGTGAGATAKTKVPKLAATAFTDKVMNRASDGYAGNALVIFTKEDDCEECSALDVILKSVDFERRLTLWKSRNLTRVGTVLCNKHTELCERFGVQGSTGNEPGLPHILWFKGGVEQGAYNGGHNSVADFDKWVFHQSLPHVLWFKNGQLNDVYDGGISSVDDFKQWVLRKQDVVEL